MGYHEPGSGGSPIASHRRRIAVLAVTLVLVGAALAFYHLRNGQFRWDAFVATLKTVDSRWFATSAALMLGTYVVRALRWRIMLRPLLPHPKIWPLISSTCIGFTAVMLFGRPGELVRPYLISLRERVPFSSQLAAWLLERMYDMLMVLLIFGYALAHMKPNPGSFGPAIEWTMRAGGYVAGAIGALCVAILIAASLFGEATRKRLGEALAFLPPHLHKKATDLVEAFTSGMSAAKSLRQVVQLLSWSVVEWFMIAAATLALFRSFPVTAAMSWLDVMIFLGFVAFGSIVQIPGIGGGLQVAAVIVLTEVLAVALAPATAVALLFWVVAFVLVVPIGFGLMIVEGVKLKALRKITDQELEGETLVR